MPWDEKQQPWDGRHKHHHTPVQLHVPNDNNLFNDHLHNFTYNYHHAAPSHLRAPGYSRYRRVLGASSIHERSSDDDCVRHATRRDGEPEGVALWTARSARGRLLPRGVRGERNVWTTGRVEVLEVLYRKSSPHQPFPPPPSSRADEMVI
ncbi:hypothetical protein M7I_1359 [Glarea lozoyensis 74030]|uniref:Uncharacterized protein n=1 Tax=Glarea lozoyensis (strain ATCC 74030 / MF5533) TaxID=1104152 RepID=H0EFV1_GLAL7|nr:hypothetical protein M7I_1359 [Glarea lozoyensis 74030]